MGMTERLTINEAAERLGVSADTIRRRVKRGELRGERKRPPRASSGAWSCSPMRRQPPPDVIATVEAAVEAVELAQLRERVAGLERLTEELQTERDAWRDQAQRDGEAARELRVLLRNEQMRALQWLRATGSRARR